VSRGSVQPFYRHIGEEGLGVSGPGEARPAQGRGKGPALPARCGSAVGNRRLRGACELAEAGYGAWQIAGSRPNQWLVTARCGSRLARLAGAGMPHRVVVLLYWPGQTTGEERRKREGERKRSEFKLIFLKFQI
jgi:hypothetical protein